MNLPNLISFARLFITFFFIVAINKELYRIGFYLFVLQAFTDLLDGFLARIMGTKTRLGAFLDPAADKTMLLAAYIMLTIKSIVPVWLLSIIVARDLIIVTGFAILFRFSFQEKPSPSIWGKLTTMLQIVTVAYLLLWPKGEYAMYLYIVTALSTTISGIHYMVKGFELFVLKNKSN